MATFRLVAIGDLDTTQAQFAFQVSGENTYLQFGLLDVDNRRHFESVISGGRVGFFEAGSDLSDSEAPNARIVADYDVTNGVEIDEIPPTLSVGSDYQIKWSQARPGAPADGDGETLLDVTLIRKVEIQGLEEHTLSFEYNIGPNGRPGRYWGAKWFGSIADLESGTPELEEAQTPENVSITPPELAETEGLHFFHLAFTPQFEGDHYVAFVLDPQDETEPEAPVRPTDGLIIEDVDGYAVRDVDGFYLVQVIEESWAFLQDVDGYELVDVDGNRLVEVTELT
ncbi:MAG: hypothetical protein OXH00_02670 [Candidatus Poribacteria bacterium]|nr:hypothetical protein [Candidatus Poribacteria bacterium]